MNRRRWWMTARFPGRCTCGAPIVAGRTKIEFLRTATRGSIPVILDCPTCAASRTTTTSSTPDASDLAYEDACAAAAGVDSLTNPDR